MAFNYFTIEYAINIHDKILEKTGGNKGIKDFGSVDSLLTHIQNDEYYPCFEEKLTHLVFSINKFHAFNDGNKRTSIAVGAFFLEINGLAGFVDKFIIEMENIAVAVADNIVDKGLLEEIITSILNFTEYSESLKLKLINALQPVQNDIQPNLGPDFYKSL